MELPADEIVLNEDWEKGQLSSIQAALRSLPEGTDGILLCLIDHPLISAELVNDLIAQFYATRAPIVLPVYEGKTGASGGVLQNGLRGIGECADGSRRAGGGVGACKRNT